VRYFSSSPDGNMVLVGTTGSARLLRPNDEKGLEGEDLFGTYSRGGVFLPDGKGALFGQRVTVDHWDARSRKMTETSAYHTGSVSAVAVDARGTRTATGSFGVGRIWDMRTGNPIGLPLRHPGELFRGVAFSPDGKLLVSLTYNGSLRFWHAATSRPVGPVMRLPGRGNALAFLPDGSAVLLASSDKLVRRLHVPRRTVERADLLRLRTEVITGMELDAAGVRRILSPESWRERRERLEKLAPGTVPYLEPE
jgi:WD40 repeat protein